MRGGLCVSFTLSLRCIGSCSGQIPVIPVIRGLQSTEYREQSTTSMRNDYLLISTQCHSYNIILVILVIRGARSLPLKSIHLVYSYLVYSSTKKSQKNALFIHSANQNAPKTLDKYHF
jgi:hypothetical protein